MDQPEQDQQPKTFAEAIAAKLPTREIQKFFAGEVVTAANIVIFAKHLMNEYHMVLPLPFLQDFESLVASIEAKITGKG